MKLIFYKKISRKNNFGFSVPEMIVSLFFFSMIMVIAVSTVLSVSLANRKVFALSSVNNSMVYAVDSMIRDVRTGRDYDCGPVGGGSFLGGVLGDTLEGTDDSFF
jgi:type II secretory pathway component PulJ